MNTFWASLKHMQKNLSLSITISMLLGLLIGSTLDASILKSLIVPITILMVLPMLATVNLKKVFTKCSYKLQLGTQFLNFFIIPIIGYSIGILLLKDAPNYAYGLFLISVLPTSGMTISWTGFAKGNIDMAIKMVIISLVLGALVVPLYSSLLMSTAVEISIFHMFQKILVMIIIPLVFGAIIRLFLIKKFGQDIFENHYKPKFPLIATAAVIGIIFIAISLKAKVIIEQPSTLLYLLLPLFIFYFLSYLISTIIAKKFFNYQDGIALIFGTAMRNLSVSLAIAMTVFPKQGSEIALIIAAAYILQVQSAALYIRYAKHLLPAK